MTPDPVIIGKRLRQARRATGLSQTEMAEKLGFGSHAYPAVSKIESGKRKVSAIELHRWARICGTTSDAILNGEPLVIEAAS